MKSKLLLLCLLTMASYNCYANTPGEVMEGEYLRNVSMMGLNSPDQKLSEFRGQPLIINLWASWCGPCRAEMQSLESLYQHHSKGRFKVIGISVDDYPLKAYALIDQTGISFANFIDRKLVLENMLGANRIPLTLLIDKEGKILKKIRGSKPWDDPAMIQLILNTFEL